MVTGEGTGDKVCCRTSATYGYRHFTIVVYAVRSIATKYSSAAKFGLAYVFGILKFTTQKLHTFYTPKGNLRKRCVFTLIQQILVIKNKFTINKVAFVIGYIVVRFQFISARVFVKCGRAFVIIKGGVFAPGYSTS